MICLSTHSWRKGEARNGLWYKGQPNSSLPQTWRSLNYQDGCSTGAETVKTGKFAPILQDESCKSTLVVIEGSFPLSSSRQLNDLTAISVKVDKTSPDITHKTTQLVLNPQKKLWNPSSLISIGEMTGVKKQHRFQTVSVKTRVSDFNGAFYCYCSPSFFKARQVSITVLQGTDIN